MVDDWLLAGLTIPDIMDRCAKLAAMFESVGLSMQPDKNVYGTSVKYLGVIFDTVTMKMRIDETQALGTRLLLQDVLIAIQGHRKVGHTTLYHLAGKLNWFSEVLQSGRLHTHSFWDYLRMEQDQAPPDPIRGKLIADLVWWIGILKSWEQGRGMGLEYRILSAATLRDDPRSIYVVQSDASGEDGVGYIHGWLDESDPHYGSHAWGPEGAPGSSHSMELRALRLCLEEYNIAARDCLLLWITDSTSAALSVNKGNCSSPHGFRELEAILGACDWRRIEIVAFWIPRADNVLADYLSHLSAVMNRERVHGRLSGLAAPAC